MKREGLARVAATGAGVAICFVMAASSQSVAVTTTGETQSSPFPPKNLKLVGDHWTAWEPPTPPDGAEVYVIRKGDTLWDLAARDLSDPYLWPRIWDLNRYVLDSHWIYPGDPLLLPGPVTVVADEEMPPEVDAGDDGGAGEADAGFDVPVEAAMLPPDDPSGQPRVSRWQKRHPDDVADRSEMLCAGYIVAEPEESEFYVYAAEENGKYGLAPGDVIYLNEGLEDGVNPGDKFFVVHKEEKIMHPVFNRRVGWMFRKKAVVQVMTAQANTATAEIIEGCDTVHLGYSLVRYSDLVSPKRRDDIELARFDTEDNGNVSGHVIYGNLFENAMGVGDLVFIDLGMADGVEKGDYLSIYRDNVTGQKRDEAGFRNWKWKHKSSVRAYNVPAIPKGMAIPRTMLGDLVVIDTNHHTAVAKIMTSWREVYPGDEVQLLQ
ncbi:MAG: LysM peptidoglycan-binding domain-containing protein [Acidobacteriota bacterium]